MMKQIIRGGLLLLCCIAMAACQGRTSYVGRMEDEFGNRFELKADMSATIELCGTGKLINTTWEERHEGDETYAAIAYNGNPHYFLLTKEGMFRHMEDMKQHRKCIEVRYVEE